MADPTPLPLHGPTSKERRYDRQLRLWAANGQAALEEAHVLLINGGPGVAGVEALKNLVLPGVGQFTILDPALVTEADLGVNFFLEDEDLGAFRAERCTKWLNELNPDVQGHAISEPLETFLTRPDALVPYTLLLTTLPMTPELLEIVCKDSQALSIPVFYMHSIGFYAHFTLQLPPAFPIVDTHPDPESTQDLRLLEPWPELLQLAKEKIVDLEQMDAEQHGHVPYVLLLLYYLQEWKTSHEGQVPQNYKEKSAFREMVRSDARTNTAEGGEENFDEAVAAVLKSLNPSVASSAVMEVFEAPECREITSASPTFWLIAHAVHLFYQANHVLPLSGSVPDMKAKSADYITLQSTYKSKARADVASVTQTVRQLEQQTARPNPISGKDVEAFCKSASYIKLVRGRPPHFAKPGDIKFKDRAKAVMNALGDLTSLVPLYLAFLAYDVFASTHVLAASTEVTPGSTSQRPASAALFDDLATASAKMTSIAHKLMDNVINEDGSFLEEPEYSALKDQLGKICEDLCNAQGGELHNISAVAGGVVAQEAIKVITKQYVPVDNTWCFDGVRSLMGVVRV